MMFGRGEEVLNPLVSFSFVGFAFDSNDAISDFGDWCLHPFWEERDMNNPNAIKVTLHNLK